MDPDRANGRWWNGEMSERKATEDWCWDVPSPLFRSEWIWGKGGHRDKQRWNGEVSERKAIQNLWWAAAVSILVFSIWIWDDLSPCVSDRSFVLSFGNFEPLDARPSSQCSSRTPRCLFSRFIAMTQPGYISNSFNVFCNFVKIYTVYDICFFRLEDLRQRLQMPLQRLWKGTSPGREIGSFLSHVWIGQVRLCSPRAECYGISVNWGFGAVAGGLRDGVPSGSGRFRQCSGGFFRMQSALCLWEGVFARFIQRVVEWYWV